MDERSEGWADVSIKVRQMSFSSAGCGAEMTKQLVTGEAGDPNDGANKHSHPKNLEIRSQNYDSFSFFFFLTLRFFFKLI